MGRRSEDDDDDDDDDRRPARRGFRCPYCGSRDLPFVQSRVSTAGWITLVVMVLFCLPLFWIGLLIKEEYRECGECGMKLGG